MVSQMQSTGLFMGGLKKGMKKGMYKGHDRAAHPGFDAVASQIAAKQGVSNDAARAILASSSRHASAAAHRKNPNLNKVKG